MNKRLLLTFLFFLSLPAFAQKVDFQRADSLKVMSLFAKAKTLGRTATGGYMVFFARQLRGVPYVGKTLEKSKDERLVVNLRQLDCTTYVETVLALSRCMVQRKPTFANYCDQLRRVRYAGGVVSYPTRQHYFTYWILRNDKEGIVKDLQAPNPPFKAVQTVKADYMTRHLSQYPMLTGKPEWVGKIKAMEDSITGMRPRYIPKSAIDNSKLLRRTVRDGDILGLVTKKDGLEISHVGIAVWHRDGLHLLNASSLYHKVVEDSNLLRTYLGKRKTEVGIRVARPQ